METGYEANGRISRYWGQKGPGPQRAGLLLFKIESPPHPNGGSR